MSVLSLSAPASAASASRRSPNRQRLIARIALWTVVFPAAGLIIPRLLF